MTKFEIQFSEKLPDDICKEIAKRACYCDVQIVSSAFDKPSKSLIIEIEKPELLESVKVKVNQLVDKMKSERLVVQPKVIKDRIRQDNSYHPNVYKMLCENGDIFKEGTGVIAKGGEFLNLLMTFDAFFEKLGILQYQAKPRTYSTLVPSDWLKRAGYFTSFAHSLTFAFHLVEDLEKLDAFAERHSDNQDLKLESIDEIATPEFCLSPAVCYHAYGALEGVKFDESDNGLKVFTAQGSCFRYESKNITDLDRLWEFSMREIIFVGEKEKVIASRKESMDIIWRLIEILDLTASIETASDPFFSTEFKSLRFFQLANELKYELNLFVSEEKSIAAASFNYHENFFGANFSISNTDGSEVHTGCAAFGLERLVYAVYAQIGYKKAMKRLQIASEELLGERA